MQKIHNYDTINRLVMFSNSNLMVFVLCDFWVPQCTFSDPKLRSALKLGHINCTFSSSLPDFGSLF